MSLIGGLTAAFVLLGGGSAAGADGPASLDTAGLTRRPIRFSAAAGDLAVEVLTGREGCLFEGDDGRRSARVFLVSRGGRPVAVAPVVETEPFEPDRPLRPPPRPVWAAAHGQLPLADGPAAFEARLTREAWGPDARVSLACPPPPPPSARSRRQPTAAEALAAAPIEAVGAALFAPVILFGVPSENRSLVAAAGAGPAVADRLTPGEPVPGGLEAFARDHRKLVRVFRAPRDDYAIVTVDLGGRPRYGIGTPRDAAFFGVRDGIVEWRAGRDMALETTLCATREGRFRGRPGCTTTGYYNPEP